MPAVKSLQILTLHKFKLVINIKLNKTISRIILNENSAGFMHTASKKNSTKLTSEYNTKIYCISVYINFSSLGIDTD
jgi:hypothetical protein